MLKHGFIDYRSLSSYLRQTQTPPQEVLHALESLGLTVPKIDTPEKSEFLGAVHLPDERAFRLPRLWASVRDSNNPHPFSRPGLERRLPSGYSSINPEETTESHVDAVFQELYQAIDRDQTSVLIREWLREVSNRGVGQAQKNATWLLAHFNRFLTDKLELLRKLYALDSDQFPPEDVLHKNADHALKNGYLDRGFQYAFLWVRALSKSYHDISSLMTVVMEEPHPVFRMALYQFIERQPHFDRETFRNEVKRQWFSEKEHIIKNLDKGPTEDSDYAHSVVQCLFFFANLGEFQAIRLLCLLAAQPGNTALSLFSLQAIRILEPPSTPPPQPDLFAMS